MRFCALVLAAAFALGACNEAEKNAPESSAQLEAPAPESEPSRTFGPLGQPASRVTGALEVSVAQNFPDADAADRSAGPREVLSLNGANGYRLEAELVGAAPPSVQVEGQTLRGAMALPVEATNVLIYRVRNETKSGNAGVCGEATAGHVLVWEPEAAGDPVLKLMGLLGGAPGEAGVRLCPALDYRRS